MENNVGHIGRETTATALGKKWTFARWDRLIWVKIAEWGKTMLPNPLDVILDRIDRIVLKDAEILRGLRQADEMDRRREVAALAKCTTDTERAAVPPHVPMAGQYTPKSDDLANRAQDKANSYLSFNSPELGSLIFSAVGQGKVLHLLLQKHHPDIDEDTAFDIAQDLMQQITGTHTDPQNAGKDATEIDRVTAVTAGRTPPKPKNVGSPAA